MPSRMTTRSGGHATVAPRGGRIGGRTGRGGGRTRGQSSDQGNGRINGQSGQIGGQGNEVNDGVDGVLEFSTIIAHQLQNLLPTILAQVGNQGSNQGNHRNQNGDTVNDNIHGDVRNALTWWNSLIHTRSQEASVGMSWEDFKTLTREEFCPVNEMQKLETEFWNHAMVGAGHAAYTDRFHELARAVQKARTLTDEAVRNGSLKKHPEKRRNDGEPNRDRNARDENKRTRTGNAFATTINPVRREYNGTIPKCDYSVAPRMVNPVNARNPTAAPGACYECGGTDHFKAVPFYQNSLKKAHLEDKPEKEGLIAVTSLFLNKLELVDKALKSLFALV
ncbi:reverse transcriptase domain-containing protein [Tanacetum coccineum]